MRKPFTHALAAALYIAFLVLAANATSSILPSSGKEILIPMGMLSLFVLSAAIMGFIFLSEPFYLYMDNHRQEAVAFFAKTVGFFAGFTILFLALLLLFK